MAPSAVSLPDGRLLMVGGGDSERDTRDAHSFDPDSHIWRRLQVSGDDGGVHTSALRQGLVLAEAPAWWATAGSLAVVAWGGSAYLDAARGYKGACMYTPNAKVLLAEKLP